MQNKHIGISPQVYLLVEATGDTIESNIKDKDHNNDIELTDITISHTIDEPNEKVHDSNDANNITHQNE